MMTKHAFVFLIILAVCFTLYGILILATASGTSFFLIWFAAAALAFCYAVLIRSGLFTRMSFLLRFTLTLPLLAGIITVLILSGVIMLFAGSHGIQKIPESNVYHEIQSSEEASASADASSDGGTAGAETDIVSGSNTGSFPSYLIVLGAQVRKSGPSLVLKHRLDTAAEYLEAHPDTICVVSGGKGGNEPFPEAEGMRRYLEEKGISPDRMLLEDQSLNTVQNLRFSRLVIEEDLVRRGTSTGTMAANPDELDISAAVILVTNDFHLFRATAIAEKQGYLNVLPLAAGSSPLYLPNNLLRECLGLVKDFLLGNLAFR